MITSRNFDPKLDFDILYNFLIDNFSFDRKNGAEATWFVYSSCYLKDDLIKKNKIWFEDEKVISYVSIEMDLGEVYFFFNNELVDELVVKEMIEYAKLNLRKNDSIIFHSFSNQTKLKNVLKSLGYTRTEAWKFYNLDFDYEINYQLPNNFKFINSNEININKLKELIWKGFNNDGINIDTTQLLNIRNSKYYINLDVCVVNEKDEYIGYAGVWYESKNNLCYLEPFCVVPEYRHLGIGKAIISEVIKRTKTLGANKMTGGVSDFYPSIGFISLFRDEIYE